MGCGSRIESSQYSRWELADKLREHGDWRHAHAVERNECLTDRELREVEHELERAGIQKHWDYRERQCECSHEEEY